MKNIDIEKVEKSGLREYASKLSNFANPVDKIEFNGWDMSEMHETLKQTVQKSKRKAK